MGLIAYDKRSGEILYGWAKPQGNYSKPDWEFVFHGNKDILDNLGVIETNLNITTLQAKREYRVVDGELKPKPAPTLSVSRAVSGEPCRVNVCLGDHQIGGNFDNLKATVAGRGLTPVGVTLHPGENLLIFDVLGELELTIVDDRVCKKTVFFEVLPGEG